MKKAIIFFICFLAVFFCILLPIRKELSIKQDIRDGRLKYFPKIGWVDMGHANPTGPKKMTQELEKHLGGTLNYSQDMKKKFLGLTLIIKLENRYSIPKNISKKKNGIIRYLFEDVSKDFEKFQNNLLLRPFCGNGIGDINGDRVALMRALKIKTQKELDAPLKLKNALREKRNYIKESSVLEEKLPQKIPVYKYDSKVSYTLSF